MCVCYLVWATLDVWYTYIRYCAACGVISEGSKKKKINHDIRRSGAACRSIMRGHCFICAHITHMCNNRTIIRRWHALYTAVFRSITEVIFVTAI